MLIIVVRRTLPKGLTFSRRDIQRKYFWGFNMEEFYKHDMTSCRSFVFMKVENFEPLQLTYRKRRLYFKVNDAQVSLTLNHRFLFLFS